MGAIFRVLTFKWISCRLSLYHFHSVLIFEWFINISFSGYVLVHFIKYVTLCLSSILCEILHLGSSLECFVGQLFQSFVLGHWNFFLVARFFSFEILKKCKHWQIPDWLHIGKTQFHFLAVTFYLMRKLFIGNQRVTYLSLKGVCMH